MMIQPEKKKGDENEGAFSAFPSQYPPLAFRETGRLFSIGENWKIFVGKICPNENKQHTWNRVDISKYSFTSLNRQNFPYFTGIVGKI